MKPEDDAVLDRVLKLGRTPPLDIDAFAARAMASFAEPPANVVSLRRRALAPAWALAACLLIGVLVGLSAGVFAPSDGAEQSVAAALGAFDGEGG